MRARIMPGGHGGAPAQKEIQLDIFSLIISILMIVLQFVLGIV